jgi:hypothetical protein
MKIFKLTPSELNENDWRSSTWKADVVVRAPSEKAARWAASLAFNIATPRLPGVPVSINPWRQEKLVRVKILSRTEVDEAGWFVEGPVEILDPPNHSEALTAVNWSKI